MRNTLSASSSAKKVVKLLFRLYFESQKIEHPVNQRAFVELCRRIRHEERIEPALQWEASNIGQVAKGFLQEVCINFAGRQIPSQFLKSWLLGEPLFNYEIDGFILDIVTQGDEGLNLWFFLEQGANKKLILMALNALAQRIEANRGTRCANIVLHHNDPSRKEVISLESLHNISNEIENIPMDAERSQTEQAAVVILDVEGQFKKHIEVLANMTNRLSRELGFHGEILPSFLEIPTNTSLSFEELRPEDLTYFTPDLTVKSQDSFRTAIAHALTYSPTGFIQLIERIEADIESGVRNAQIRSSLARTTASLRRVHKELFDKPEAHPLRAADLLKPGRITVVDVSSLTEEDQRYVAIYLLAILHNSKMVGKENIRTVLFIDEAHKMFPRTSPSQYRDFYQRIYSFVNDIVHKGRKRRYGVVIATQQPKDVAEPILRLPDTKIIFEVEGERKWLAEMLNGRPQPKGVGIAAVVLKGTRVEPMLIKTPNVMELSRISSSIPRSNIANDDPVYPGEQVGYIIQREKTPLKYKVTGGQLTAYIPSKTASRIIPGELLVAKGEVDGHITTLFCQVREIHKGFETRGFVSSLTEQGLKDISTEDYQTFATLRPGREISTDSYDGPFRNQDYSNMPLYMPTEDEIRTCNGLPRIGVPLGELILPQSSQQPIVHFLPYNPSSYEPEHSEWQIDHSVLVVGSQGRGKTNFLLYLACMLAHSSPEELGSEIIRFSH